MTPTIVLLTAALVAGVRKLIPRIDGPWLVFAAALIVAAALVAAEAIGAGEPLSWRIAAEGGAAAAAAFGFASLSQWATALLPGVTIDARGGNHEA